VIKYYTMESVRNIIKDRYEVRQVRENSVPLPNWNRYPCPIIEKCEQIRQKFCTGYLSIYVNTKTVRFLFLEICFFREKQRAFIRADGLSMRKLFELGIITNKNTLDEEEL